MNHQQREVLDLLSAGGGPAAPTTAVVDGDSYTVTGATMLDFFAGQALVAMFNSPAFLEGTMQAAKASDDRDRGLRAIAISAFEIAEAMLMERDRRLKDEDK